MSGLKPPELSQFYRKINARGLTTTVLAESVGVSRTALCRVLNGSRRRGPIWRRVAPLLTADEVGLLDVAHRHPWNRKRLRARPKWNKAAKFFAASAERGAA